MATPWVKFRLSDEVHALWQEQAESCEVSLSEWIRDCCNSRLQACTQARVVDPLPAPQKPPQLVVALDTPKRNYTGETALMFHKKHYEYLDENGKSMWTLEAP